MSKDRNSRPERNVTASATLLLLLGLGFILLAVATYSAFTLRTVKALRGQQSEITDRNRRDSLQLLRIQNNLNSLAMTMRDMLDAAEPYPLVGYRAQFQRIRDDLEDGLRQERLFSPRTRTPDQDRALQLALDAMWRSTDEMFDLAKAGQDKQARELLGGALQPQQASLSTMVARLLVENNEAEEAAATAVQETYDRVERSLYRFLALTFLAIIATSVAVVFFNGRIFRRLGLLSAQKSELARKLIDLQEQMLRSISRELHDEFGQILTAVGAMLRRAERKSLPPDSPLRAELQEVQEITQSALSKIRTLSQILHPAVLDDYGFEKSLDWYIPMFERQTGLKVQYEKSGEGPAIPPESAIHAYRLLQEALNNAARHSGAQSALVRLQHQPGAVILEVEDHGKGISEAPRKPGENGLGLVAMRERAELLGAELVFKRPAEGGTLVSLKIPLKVKESESKLGYPGTSVSGSRNKS